MKENEKCCLCIFGYNAKWNGPKTILSIGGKRYVGHRRCVKRIHDMKMKEVVINRHTTKW